MIQAAIHDPQTEFGDDGPPLADLEARALWHRELEQRTYWMADADLDDDHPDDYDDDDDFGCTRCGGEGFDQVDDPLWDRCDEYGYGPCCACHGTGLRRHQWVF